MTESRSSQTLPGTINQAEAHPRKPRIMVVDDLPENLLALHASLAARGYEVAPQRSGEAALIAAAQNPPDLILLDIAMPGLDGYEVCQRLKADPHLAQIPILFLSGLGEVEDKVKAFQAGGLDFIPKPFKLEELHARVRIHLQLGELQRELRHRNAHLEQVVAQLEAANQELDSFSYSVSHDLRSPVRAIEQLTDMLSEDHGRQLDEPGRNLLSLIQSKARHADRLIEDLLRFSRLGRQALQTEAINMEALARSVLDECLASVPERRVDAKLHSLPPACGDRAMLTRVFVNLISNALKYTRPRAHTEIEIHGYSEAGECIYCVKDNGVGFDMKYVDKLFGVFQRLHTQEEFEGTGVGLALVQRVLSRHHGRVWAESRPNEGAKFCFALPMPVQN
jgi:two-component system sensor histidine kinase/response regulator